jgi:hypothetical protein
MKIEGYSLTGARNRFGHEINVYDDHFGDLYVYRDAGGLLGIVRAQSWEDAFGICEDEFLSEAPSWEEMASFVLNSDESLPTLENGSPDYGVLIENESWCESYGFRPSGRNDRDVIGHGIYQRDLNGEQLEALTPAMLVENGWTLILECDECDAAVESTAAIPACATCAAEAAAEAAEAAAEAAENDETATEATC